ncbi:MAG: VanZ family protein [Bacteroidota bacterium]
MAKIIFPIIYVLLVIYGSLYPWSGWAQPDFFEWQNYFNWRTSKSDIVLNILVYLPFGLLFVRAFISRLHGLWLVLLACAAGFGLSLGVEILQLFLPHRVTSVADLLMNTTGTFLGGLLAYFVFAHASISGFLLHYRDKWFSRRALESYGLLVIGLWVLSQLTPLVPSLGWSNIKHGLKPAWHTLLDIALYDPVHALVYALNLLGLCIIVMLIGRSRSKALLLFGLLIAAVFMFKVPVYGRQLSLEAISGCLLAFLVAFCIKNSSHRFLIFAGALSISIGFLIQQLAPVTGAQALSAFSWIPFRGHLSGSGLMGLAIILESVWPFAALGFLGLYSGLRNLQMAFVGLAILVFVFLTEWAQQYIPGRYPDITDVILAMLGWGTAMLNPMAGYIWESC